ncbi:YbaK/EbsC family protein [[Eubacterium] hominis]|uniref:YbaK/EbsC family protein n=1 Tax=[Eubacterium] hominis TaxID=2764325 RepID=UPI003A4D94B9
MAIELVREYLKQYGRSQDIIELEQSSATVELAAQALDTQPERIAKTLSFMGSDGAMVIVCAGDCKVDNHKFKETFGVKAKMLKPEEVESYTNHTIGGVCPFAIPQQTKIYLDESMKRFDYVYPACGSANSAIKLSIDELEQLIPYQAWVNVCKGWE